MLRDEIRKSALNGLRLYLYFFFKLSRRIRGAAHVSKEAFVAGALCKPPGQNTHPTRLIPPLCGNISVSVTNRMFIKHFGSLLLKCSILRLLPAANTIASFISFMAQLILCFTICANQA